jgi:hypothetical protein
MHQRRRVAANVCAALCAGVVVTACGQWQQPTATSPSDIGVASASGSGDGGTITGTVHSATHAMSGANAASPMTVTVVGTTIKAVVSASGRFKLENVPAINVRLQFSGQNVNASVDAGDLHAHDTIDLQLTVTVTTVVVESAMHLSEDGTAELEGAVTQISGSCPSANVTIGDWTGNLSASANDCNQIRVGVRVRLIGKRMNASVMVVVRVVVSVPAAPTSPANGGGDHHDDDDDGDD